METASSPVVHVSVPRWLPRYVRALGVVLFVLGIGHNIVSLPRFSAALTDGRIGLPSQLDVPLGQLTWQIVLYGIMLMGIDANLLGVVLIMLAPEIADNRRVAWRIALLIGSYLLLVYTAVWVVFEHASPRPLPMPAVGLALAIPLWRHRHCFKSAQARHSGF